MAWQISLRPGEEGHGDRIPKHEFEQCSKGNLLIISLGMEIGTKIFYPISSRMNHLAANLCADNQPTDNEASDNRAPDNQATGKAYKKMNGAFIHRFSSRSLYPIGFCRRSR